MTEEGGEVLNEHAFFKMTMNNLTNNTFDYFTRVSKEKRRFQTMYSRIFVIFGIAFTFLGFAVAQTNKKSFRNHLLGLITVLALLFCTLMILQFMVNTSINDIANEAQMLLMLQSYLSDRDKLDLSNTAEDMKYKAEQEKASLNVAMEVVDKLNNSASTTT